MSALTPQSLHGILRQVFPAQNDFQPGDYVEEWSELKTFGIQSEDELQQLLERRREEVLRADREELDEEHIHWYSEEIGAEVVKERIAAGYWFSLQGLLRIAMELEFGEVYIEFAEKRDGI